MANRDGMKAGGDKNRYGDGNVLDIQVEEAVKRLTQGTFRESPPNNILRMRRLKSLPGGRSYDWNSAHFFPDQHEVNLALTFQVPDRKSSNGDRLSRQSAQTFISVSREGPNVSRGGRFNAGASRDWNVDNNNMNINQDNNNYMSSGVIRNVDESVVVVDSEDENFEKVWQRSPVMRRKKREGQSMEVMTPMEVVTSGLPPKGSPQARVKGVGRNELKSSTQAGSARLVERRMTMNQFPPKERDQYRNQYNRYQQPEEIKYSEVKLNKYKTLSLEDLCNTGNKNFKTTTTNDQKHKNIHHRNTTSFHTSPSTNASCGPDNSLKRSINASPIDWHRSIKINSIGSDESSFDYKTCDEEEKLRWQGYEIDTLGSCASSNDNKINIVPADDYVYVLKKVLRRPVSAVGRLDSSREVLNHEKEIRVQNEVDFIPEQRYLISKPEAGVPRIKKFHDNNNIDFNRYLREKDLKNNQTKQKPRVTFSPEREFIQIYHNTSADKSIPHKESPKTKYFNQKMCDFKPPKAPKDVSKSFVPSHHAWQNHSLDQKLKSSANRKFSNPPKSDTTYKPGYHDRVTNNNELNSTIFGLTGYKHSPEGNEAYNQHNSSKSPRGNRYFVDKSFNLSSGNADRPLDVRRKPISGWLELGSDLEHDLKYGTSSDSNVDGSIPVQYDFTNLSNHRGRQTASNETDQMSYSLNKHHHHINEHHHIDNHYHIDNHHHNDKHHHIDKHHHHIDKHHHIDRQNHENRDAIGLIFDAIDQQSNYFNQSDSLRRSSINEAIYSQPNKLEKSLKTQDRCDDLIFLDLHAKPKSDHNSKFQDHFIMSKKAVRPSSFTQALKSCNTSNQNRYANVDIKPIKSLRTKSSSYSLPGSRENIRRDSSSEEDYEKFSVANIKAKLFGPNEENANSLLVNDRYGIGKLYSKNRTQNVVGSSHVSKNVRKNYFSSQERDDNFMESDSSSSSSDVGDQEYLLNNFPHKLKLKEISSESFGSLGARKDLDDMASRRYKISSKWNARSNPDLSHKERSKVQTTYPRKTSRTASKEKLSKANDQSVKEFETRTNIPFLENQSLDSSAISKSKNYLTRRQSLCTGVAKLVNLFEKSTSAPNLLEENLFINSYSEAGDPLVDMDGEDVADKTSKQTKTTSKQSGNKYKKNKKSKIRLLKSSDSGYIESETDSITSSGKDCRENKIQTLEDVAESSADRCDKYDKDKRQRDLKQIKDEFLNSISSPTNNNFVSRKVLPLNNKMADNYTKQDSHDHNSPYFERRITSFGQTNLSAFDKVTKPPILRNVVSKQEATKNDPFKKINASRGMSVLVEKVINVPIISKALPIMASKFPSGFLPQPIKQTFNKDYLAPPTKQNFSKFERFELSDDGNLTDCTDVTIDAILAHNQLGALSPTSTLDCSDFEMYQTAFPPHYGNKHSAIKSESARASQPCDVKAAPHKVTKMKEQPQDVDREKRSIKELVDTFEVLLTNTGPTKSSVFT